MEKPAFESPEEKKRKKAEKDSTENQSRFEQLQAALRRALESLLDPPDSESQSAKEPRLKVSRRERIDDGETTYGRLAEPEAAARPYRPVITPYNPEVQARHFSESPEDELSVSPQSQDTQINTMSPAHQPYPLSHEPQRCGNELTRFGGKQENLFEILSTEAELQIQPRQLTIKILE